MFVQARNVYPELLLARLFFALGATATATMVTAVLPSMTVGRHTGNADDDTLERSPPQAPINDEAIGVVPSSSASGSKAHTNSSPTRLAGLVGAFTGLGALIALGCFLPLPAQFSKLDVTGAQALEYTFYVVGSIALIVALVCFVGLRNLRGEEHKSWRQLSPSSKEASTLRGNAKVVAYQKLLTESLSLGARDPLIGLGYLGGFVARASSVGITLFIPLYVNQYFISTGLCDATDPTQVKKQCREAYVLASELTGISQLVALICAPIFGLVDHKFPRYHAGLLVATVCGILGYTGLALIDVPDPSREGGTGLVFIAIALLGISQIGAIVCSLGLLGRAVASPEDLGAEDLSGEPAAEDPARSREDSNEQDDESVRLLHDKTSAPTDRHRLQGSIAGVYSFCGGAGILLLTKLGGYLFDSRSPASPFVMMAAFNGILLIGTGSVIALQLVAFRSAGKSTGSRVS